jgi:hypothetical protein
VSNQPPDFYAQTKFFAAARRYGYSSLLLTVGWLVGLVSALVVLALFLHDCLADDGIKALGVAYISLGAALFGIVLAGLAVVATFFDREYVLTLRAAGSLNRALFGFWWVATIAVFSLLASVALTVAVYAGGSEEVIAVALTLSTGLFVAALLEALSLVGTMMRHGLYRAELFAQAASPPPSAPGGAAPPGGTAPPAAGSGTP